MWLVRVGSGLVDWYLGLQDGQRRTPGPQDRQPRGRYAHQAKMMDACMAKMLQPQPASLWPWRVQCNHGLDSAQGSDLRPWRVQFIPGSDSAQLLVRYPALAQASLMPTLASSLASMPCGHMSMHRGSSPASVMLAHRQQRWVFILVSVGLLHTSTGCLNPPPGRPDTLEFANEECPRCLTKSHVPQEESQCAKHS